MPNGDQLGDLRRVVDRVEVAAAGGAVATYTFKYSILDVARSRPHDPLGSLAPGNERIRVPFLKTIEVPDSADYHLTHYTDFTKSGRVKTIQFPTQGKYEYFLRPLVLPDPLCLLQRPDGGVPIQPLRHLSEASPAAQRYGDRPLDLSEPSLPGGARQPDLRPPIANGRTTGAPTSTRRPSTAGGPCTATSTP